MRDGAQKALEYWAKSALERWKMWISPRGYDQNAGLFCGGDNPHGMFLSQRRTYRGHRATHSDREGLVGTLFLVPALQRRTPLQRLFTSGKEWLYGHGQGQV